MVAVCGDTAKGMNTAPFPNASPSATSSISDSPSPMELDGSPASTSAQSANGSTGALTVAQKCPICGGVALNKHFGSLSCNACAAFFRRTVSYQHRYTCAHDKTCHITTGEGRHFCKFHRFRRCIQQGMTVSAVCSARTTTELQHLDPDSLLWKIVISQRATFVNRFQSIIKAYGGNQAAAQVGCENPSFGRTSVIMAAEVPVLLDYMKSSGFTELGITKTGLSQLAHAVFYTWIAFQNTMNTLRNGGHKTNIAYSIDESHIKADDDGVKRFIETGSDLKDKEFLAKLTKQCFEECMRTAELLHSLRMEDAEHAALFHIFAFRVANRLFPDNANFKQQMNHLFALLKRHYEESFDDVALKLGNIVLMVSELERLTTTFNEYITILSLSGYNSVMAKLRANAPGGGAAAQAASEHSTQPDIKPSPPTIVASS